MPQFIKDNSLWIVIVLVLLLTVLIIFTSSGREKVNFLGNFFGKILAPIQKGFYGLSSYFSDLFKGIGERSRIKNEYELLKKRVDELENQLIDMTELELQNERLKELTLFIEENEDMVVTGARVIAKNPGNWFNNINIDKGAKDGVEVNMAVVTNRGLVGRVIEVGDDWSKVRTIVDGKSAVSAIIQRNRDNGLVKGNNSLDLEDGLCNMIYLPEETNTEVGDIVLTSSLGDIFPKGIYIGEVEDIFKNPRDLYKTAVIRPGVDFQHLEEVLIVTKSQEAK